uniref:Uncharacterized protein n=1 Tax=Esox lucius TaxID=8010 RepID=A0A3P8XH14_ESOLU
SKRSVMVLPLVDLCAKEVVSDHSSSPGWLGCVPRELYRPLLDAAFTNCRPLAVGELVQRWPERTLRVGGRRRQGQSPPNRLCVQALLLAVVRGLGVRRRMEMERRKESAAAPVGGSAGEESDHSEDTEVVVVHVRADLFVNARSWDRARAALGTPGPLKLQCRYIRVEELSVSSIRSLLDLLPRSCLMGVDIRYSCLGVAGLALLLPQLAAFPALSSLRLHYCNLDVRRDIAGQEGDTTFQDRGCVHILPKHSKRPVFLVVLSRSSLSQPLEVLELPYLSLTPADLAYLSCSPHASSLQQLDLSENRLDESAVPSLRQLLSRASGCLVHLSLSGCGLTNELLAALLPSLARCRSLKSLALALNPLHLAGLLELVRTAVGMASLRQLLYPNPLEDYQPGLPPMPTSAQLLDWPLDELVAVHEATSLQAITLIVCGGHRLYDFKAFYEL